MTNLTKLVPLFLLAGCATGSVTPHLDARHGSALREAKLKMTINPDAGKKPDQVTGVDGTAARESAVRYYESFRSPPPVTNVINIGGAIGSGGGGR